MRNKLRLRRLPNPDKKTVKQLIGWYGITGIPFRVIRRQKRSVIRLIDDELWRQYIIIRDKKICRLAGLDNIRCTDVIQSMHIITRGNYRTRFDPINGMAGCTAHHKYYTHREYLFHELIRERFPGLWDRLILISKARSSAELEVIYEWLRIETSKLVHSSKQQIIYKIAVFSLYSTIFL